MNVNEIIHGYEIKQAIVFDNNRGFALAENPNAVSPFVTWQLTEDENGEREYFWGHYFSDADIAEKDFGTRVSEYQKDYGVSERQAFKYYSTLRPVDIGTFPKTKRGPTQIVNFNSRQYVENETFQAWGYLVYDAPLSERQVGDYELRAAPNNPDLMKRIGEQAQVVGKWEQLFCLADEKRLTNKHPDSGDFMLKDTATSEQLAKRYESIKANRAKEPEKQTSQEERVL